MATKSGSIGLIALICLPLVGFVRRCGDDAAKHMDTPIFIGAEHVGPIVRLIPDVDASVARWRAAGRSSVSRARDRVGESHAALFVELACLHLQSVARTGEMPSERDYTTFLLGQAGNSSQKIRSAVDDLRGFLKALQQRDDYRSISANLAVDVGCQVQSIRGLTP